MTKRTVIESGLSGTSDAQTTRLGFEDVWYEVDLTAEEREELRGAIEPYLSIGRRTLPRETARKRQVPESTAAERDRIRAWARTAGYECADRGRTPKHIREAFEADQAGNKAA
ncbi:hypothetical protein GCM10025781_26400 [Kocuria gwangalliensis]|uniref:Lsr2 family protein n=1 Tax=Kocuria gwangalliensis TaxID=501592 RepID=A0ABP8XDF0_9MICC